MILRFSNTLENRFRKADKNTGYHVTLEVFTVWFIGLPIIRRERIYKQNLV